MVKAILCCLYLVKALLERLAHGRRTAHPNFAHVVCVVLGEFSLDKCVVPPSCIDTFAAQPNNHLKVRKSLAFTQG